MTNSPKAHHHAVRPMCFHVGNKTLKKFLSLVGKWDAKRMRKPHVGNMWEVFASMMSLAHETRSPLLSVRWTVGTAEYENTAVCCVTMQRMGRFIILTMASVFLRDCATQTKTLSRVRGLQLFGLMQLTILHSANHKCLNKQLLHGIIKQLREPFVIIKLLKAQCVTFSGLYWHEMN